MANLARVYFNNVGSSVADESFPAGTVFQLSVDREASTAELAAGTLFQVRVRVTNTNGGGSIVPLPVGAAPASGAVVPTVAPARNTFSYTVPAGTGAAGDFLIGFAALIVGAPGFEQEVDIGLAECVII